ncbi:MAG: DUF721 domain-containing protein [Brevundimonas sp.]|uniref:DUF721 domain-containing protein n=1 Tax=Brevundimonas sp. TaxID=1871086 RepID=UPI0040339218
MVRALPTDAETRDILSRKRTRPAPRPAPPVGRALTKFVRELDEKYGRGAGALEPRWREIVGDQLARVTRPQKLSKGRGGTGGVLELRVAGPAALLVQHQSAEILSRVNLFLGAGSVDRLRIAQGPVAPLPMTAPARASRASRRPPPLDAAAQAELDRSLAAAPEGLKTALATLGRAVLAADPKGSD